MDVVGRMNATDLSHALAPDPGHERYVERGFWGKVRRTMARVPFLDRAIAVYYAAFDPATPMRVRAIMLAALAYFIMPFDAVPDVLAGIGFTDDAAVLLLAMRTLAPHITSEHVERARDWLAERRA